MAVKYLRPFDSVIPIEEREFRYRHPISSIVHEFARWTAMSALRSGCPIKSREDVDDALDVVDFNRLFDKGYGPIDKDDFTEWHRDTIDKLMKLEFDPSKGSDKPRKLSFGWAAKLVAIYLKTSCYLAGLGRDGLSTVIHPPLDNRLIENLKEQFQKSPDIMSGLKRFSGIGNMDMETYEAFIKSCELVAEETGYTLFEVELYW